MFIILPPASKLVNNHICDGTMLNNFSYRQFEIVNDFDFSSHSGFVNGILT